MMPFLEPWELLDLQQSAQTAQPETVTRIRTGVSNVTTTAAVLVGTGDTAELQQPTINVGKLPRWTVRVPVGTDVARGDTLQTLGKVYFITDIPRLASTYEVFLDCMAISLSYLPFQSQTWRAGLLPGQAGTTLCPCYDTIGHRTTNPSDPTCFGRGVIGGYASPVTISLYLATGAAQTRANAEGILESEPLPGVMVMSAPTPRIQREDLLIVAPDPLGTTGNPDRRYAVGDEIAPLQIFGTVVARRWQLWPIELGAIAYRVPTANTTAVPGNQYGTI